MPRAALHIVAALALSLAGCASYTFTRALGPGAESLPYRIRTSKEKHVDEVWPNDEYRLCGLEDEKGHEVLPIEFREIRFLSKDRALATREDRTLALVSLPEGTVDPTRYVHRGTALQPYGAEGSRAEYLTSEVRADRRFDITLLVNGELRPPIHDVGGASVVADESGPAWQRAVFREGACLVVHSTGEDGRALSRLYFRDGTPLGPPIDRMPGLPYLAVRGKGHTVEPEWVFPDGADLGDPDLPCRTAYRPLGDDGRTLALPAGAVGMLPIAIQDDMSHCAWAIVVDAPEGRRYLVGLGRAAAVAAPAAAPGLTRCDGLRAVRAFREVIGQKDPEMPLFAWRRVGAPGWELVSTRTLRSYPWDAATKPSPTFEELLARWEVLDAEEKARVLERLEAKPQR